MFFSLYFWGVNFLIFLIFLVPFFVSMLFNPFLKNSTFKVAKIWAKVVMTTLFTNIEINNQNNQNKIKETVIICNHQSMLDIPLLLGYLPFDFHFVLKDSLMKIPILGMILRILNFYPINRTDPKQARQSLDFIVERLNKGENILIFPEGTRSKSEKMNPFKKGALRLAIDSGADILPLALNGNFKISSRGAFKMKRAPISLNIGKIIKNPKQIISTRDFNTVLQDAVNELIK